MASENNDIGDIVKKCKILLLDIEGTTTSISFVKDKLFPYAEANVKEFLESQWENENVKEVVAALRKLAIEDEEKKMDGVVTIPGEDSGKEEQIEGLVKSVQWQMSADRKVGPLKQLQGLIWKQGYEKGDIKGHVYDDVSPALKQWLATEGQKVYIYSSGSVQAQKLLFGQSVVGDLMPLIEGYFDTAVGAKQEPASYAAIAEKIGCKPEDILFLSDILKEAEAARESGLHTALVVREGNTPLPSEASAFPVIHSLHQLTVTNKRKPDTQEEEQPAKVPKTDIEADVKTASDGEVETTSPGTTVSTDAVITETNNVDAEPENMEVEEEVALESSKTTTEIEGTPVCIETVVEEVTNSNDTADAPICDVEPVVEESTEKTEKNETEQMDTDPSEIVRKEETAPEPKETINENNKQTPTVAEETPTNVITVQEITNDNQDISENAEIIDDLVPVVEEPLNVEMEDLQNVGEVLEKECDEILSKVQDITNLDIPIKPLLNPIAEEPAETENGENLNDIVESILNSEMELGVKQSEDIDANTVREIASTHAQEVVECSSVKSDEKLVGKATESIPEDKVNNVGENNIAVENVNEITKLEIKNDESKSVAEVVNGDAQKCLAKATEDKMEGITKNEIVVPGKPNDIPVEDNNKMDSKETVEKQTETKCNMDTIKVKEGESKSTVKSILTNDKMEKDTEISKGVNTNKSDSADYLKETNENNVDKINIVKKSESTSETVKNQSESIDDSLLKSEECTLKESKAEETAAAPAPTQDDKLMETNSDTTTEIAQETKDGASDEQIATETKVNGDTNVKVNINGVANKDNELNARLSVENGENGKELNGANGNGDSEKGQGDNKIEMEIPDIKVKTISSEEPRSDPIEQPTEA